MQGILTVKRKLWPLVPLEFIIVIFHSKTYIKNNISFLLAADILGWKKTYLVNRSLRILCQNLTVDLIKLSRWVQDDSWSFISNSAMDTRVLAASETLFVIRCCWMQSLGRKYIINNFNLHRSGALNLIIILTLPLEFRWRSLASPSI